VPAPTGGNGPVTMSEITLTAGPAPQPEPVPTFKERLVGILTRPAATFARMTDADAWLWPAVMLLVGYTIYYVAYGTGGARWQTNWMMNMLATGGSNNNSDPSRQVITSVFSWLGPASQFFGNIVQVPLAVAMSWAMRTAVLYGLARLLGGEKPFWGRVVAMVGWAWVPLFVQYALTGILMLIFPSVMSFFLPLPADGTMTGAAAEFSSRWHGPMLFYLTPFVFWNLALCTIGVAELFRLPRWKASIAVLVPAVLQLGFMILSYWASTALLGAFGTMPGASPNSSPPAP
jgi:hypothetical protein